MYGLYIYINNCTVSRLKGNSTNLTYQSAAGLEHYYCICGKK